MTELEQKMLTELEAAMVVLNYVAGTDPEKPYKSLQLDVRISQKQAKLAITRLNTFLASLGESG